MNLVRSADRTRFRQLIVESGAAISTRSWRCLSFPSLGRTRPRHSYKKPAERQMSGDATINSVLSRHCCARRRGSQARVPITCVYLIASPSPESESNMPRPRQSISPAARTHLLCYLVTSALASHALTETWRVEHIVESARIWLARNMMSASWLDRLMLGQMALKLSREHLSASRAVRQSDVLTLFTNELTLNYQSPLVGHIWQMCSDALDAGSLGSGA